MEEYTNFLSDYWFWRGEYTSRNMGYLSAVADLDGAWEMFANSNECPQGDTAQECYACETFDYYLTNDVSASEYEQMSPAVRAAVAKGRAALNHINAEYPAGCDSTAGPECVMQVLIDGRPVRDAVACRPTGGAFGSVDLWKEMGLGSVRFTRIAEGRASIDLSFDLSADTEALVAEARYYVEWAKHLKAQGSDTGFCQSVASRAMSVQGLYQATRKAVAYQTRSDASRAIGLWLWDYVQGNGGKGTRGVVQRAINAIRVILKPLDGRCYADSPDRVLQGLFNRTEKCIAACEVLSFK